MPRLPKPPDCFGCILDPRSQSGHAGEGFLNGEGSCSSGLAIVGEAAGGNEANEGLPFRPGAPAGSVLERCFKLLGMDRQQHRIFNVVSCRPPRDWLEGSPYEMAAIRHCEVHRAREIRQAKPRAILALGNVAMKTLTGLTGKKRTVTQLRGYVLPGIGAAEGIPVIPSIHPSFIRRGASNMWGVLMHDIAKAAQIAKTGFDFDEARKVDYVTHPGVDEARSFFHRVRDNQNLLLAYDIENPKLAQVNEDEADLTEMGDQPITQIQFSLGVGEGICFPWIEPYIGIAREIMRLENVKAGHNVWKYDNPILQQKYGVGINGPVHDTRWAFHHMQPDLPADLQFVSSFYNMPFPWKHLAESELEWYGCADADSVQRIMAKVLKDLEKRGVLRGYIRQIFEFDPIMQGATRRGIRVNPEKLRKFGEKLDAERIPIYEQIQAHVPDGIKNLHPKGGYKKPPKEIKELEERYTANIIAGLVEKDGRHAWVAEKALELRSTIGGDEMRGLVCRPFPTGETRKELDPSGLEISIPVMEDRWAWIKPFLPNSSPQIIAYMKHKGHPVPRDFKTENDTTAKEELERLAKKTKDPLYGWILEYRMLSTMKGTFVTGWTPGPDEKIHPEFNYGPATAQIASKSPNAQNCPKHAKKRADGTVLDLASEFRDCIEPSPGHVLIELDYRAFHACTLALEAGDPDYMRLAKLDIHSFLAAQLLKLPDHNKLLTFGDEELKDRLAYIKKHHKHVRDKKAKPSILGYGFGLQAAHLYDMNRESFQDKREAQQLLDLIDGTFPKLKQFRDMIKRKAHDQRFLVSRHGYIRWFWDVFHWDGARGCMVPGEDSEKAIAFLPANDAFGHKKDAMLWLDEQGYMDKFGFVNDIHDALLFDCPERYAEECLHVVTGAMEYKSEILTHPVVAPEGFWCETEASWSRESWARMETVHLGSGTGVAA